MGMIGLHHQLTMVSGGVGINPGNREKRKHNMIRREGPRESWKKRRRESGEARFEAQVGRHYDRERMAMRDFHDEVEAYSFNAWRSEFRQWTPEQINLLEGMGVTFVDFEFTPESHPCEFRLPGLRCAREDAHNVNGHWLCDDHDGGDAA